MAVPLHHGLLRSAIVNLVLVMTLALSLMGGQVTGLPFLDTMFNSRNRRPTFETMLDNFSERVEHLTAQLLGQGAQITDLGTQLAKVTQSVSFTVTFWGRDVGYLGEDQTLKFDKVLFNAGEGYSPRTGFFTAPADGLYSFHLQMSRHPLDPSTCVEVDLIHSFIQKTPSALPKEQNFYPVLSDQQPHSVTRKERHQPPSELSEQRQSLSALPSNHHHQQQSSTAPVYKQENITSVSQCLHDRVKSTSRRAVVRLAQGDTVRAQMRSGTMLLGDVFTSMSGLRLAVLSPLFRPLLV